MSLPTNETALPVTAEAVVVASPEPDYEALRRQYEEHNRMSAVLVQMTALNFEVECFSKKHFPDGITFTLEPDPEIDDAYFVVNAKVKGTVEEVVALQNAWTGELWDRLREASRFYRLAIEFQ